MFSNVLQLTVRPVKEDDLQRLASLIHYEAHVHRHLDWRAPLDWVGYHPYLVAEHNGGIVAALACPPDPPGVAWIRLFAASTDISLRLAWDELWDAACDRLLNIGGATSIAAIPLHNWFRTLLEKSGFVRTYNVVVLSWKPPLSRPLVEISPDWTIRTMMASDLEAVEVVDVDAFSLIWQNSLSSLEVAFRQAAVATVAERGGKIVGYQISTATPMGGHLARLAVRPEFQGLGIGNGLLTDLLMQFEQRGAHSVTVNTQQDNLVSLSLYEKAGFKRIGEEYPVYQYLAGSLPSSGEK
jgi:ribosomal protein S18 acetylase RimI-like enzyme